MPARDPYLGMHPRERQQARFKEWRASKAAERARKIANAQETGVDKTQNNLQVLQGMHHQIR